MITNNIITHNLKHVNCLPCKKMKISLQNMFKYSSFNSYHRKYVNLTRDRPIRKRYSSYPRTNPGGLYYTLFNTSRDFSKISECIKRSGFSSNVNFETRTRQAKLIPIILNRRQGLGSGWAGSRGSSSIHPHLFGGSLCSSEKVLLG